MQFINNRMKAFPLWHQHQHQRFNSPSALSTYKRLFKTHTHTHRNTHSNKPCLNAKNSDLIACCCWPTKGFLKARKPCQHKVWSHFIQFRFIELTCAAWMFYLETITMTLYLKRKLIGSVLCKEKHLPCTFSIFQLNSKSLGK